MSIRDKVYFSLFSDDSESARKFSFLIQFLIFVSIVAFSIQTLPDRSEKTLKILSRLELALVSIFTVEYVLRVWSSRRPLNFVFSFYGVVDLLAILPFYLGLGGDFKSLRALRFLRLFRLFKLTRYASSLERYKATFSEIKVDLLVFFSLSLILVYLAAVGIYHFEHAQQADKFGSIFDALWWSVVTLTTTGYGDVYPVTPGGRFFASIVLVLGVGVVAVPTGLIASALTKARQKAC